MTRLKYVLPILGLLVLTDCAQLKEYSGSILSGGGSLTATIQNPVGRLELYQAENAYAIGLTAAIAYGKLPTCQPGETGGINICKTKYALQQIKAADRKVHAAVLSGRKFVRDNPTLSALSSIAAVKAAVADFNSVLVQNGVR